MLVQETINLKDNTILKIYQDMSPESPREWDNIGTMVCVHRRYNLGDKHDIDHNDYSSWEDMIEANTSSKDIVLPIYMYDHGAITISTTPFGCRWDSGQVGFIYITQERIVHEYGDDSKTTRERVTQYLMGEVETYNQYLMGEVYGFVLEDVEGEQIDSCWGFYGMDLTKNGIFDTLGIDKEAVA
jgi:hypothetical protein